MDGNGRWANQRGWPRTRGHEAGEAALLDVVRRGLRGDVLTHTKAAKILGVGPANVEPLLRERLRTA